MPSPAAQLLTKPQVAHQCRLFQKIQMKWLIKWALITTESPRKNSLQKSNGRICRHAKLASITDDQRRWQILPLGLAANYIFSAKVFVASIDFKLPPIRSRLILKWTSGKLLQTLRSQKLRMRHSLSIDTSDKSLCQIGEHGLS